MATQPYKNAAGVRVPGVTTVIGGLGWNRDALMGWANKEGRAGRDIRSRESRSAAIVGTAAHARIEAITHEQSFRVLPEEADLTVEEREQERLAVEGFLSWSRMSNLTIVATEAHGVNENLQTGWCLDALAIENDRLTLIDHKTGKAIYSDAIIQVSAYLHFAEAALIAGGWLNPGEYLTGAHILRVRGGNFSHLYRSRASLEDAWEVFVRLRWLYDQRYLIESLTK